MPATPAAQTDQDLDAWFHVRDMLETAQHVEEISTHDDSIPPRLSLTFTTPHVPAPVHDLLDLFDTRFHNPRVTDDGTLAVDVSIQAAFDCLGSNALRERGGSTLLAIPPDALARAGFAEGDSLFVDARENELRLVRDTADEATDDFDY